jgi:monothiol glutaredoxin
MFQKGELQPIIKEAAAKVAGDDAE